MIDASTASHLFAYGTLMCPEILRAVVGPCGPGRPGRLHGYVRLRVRGEDYPGLIPRPGSCVEGLVYPVPDAAWERLDRFEGPEYERRRVTVECGDGATATAWVYVTAAAFTERLVETPWSFDEFLRRAKQRFLETHTGFDISTPP